MDAWVLGLVIVAAVILIIGLIIVSIGMSSIAVASANSTKKDKAEASKLNS